MSFWDAHQKTIDSNAFRADVHFVGNQHGYPFKEMVEYIRTLKKPWLDLLKEDDSFKCVTGDVDGVTVSRDLLDSILELEFLETHCGFSLDDMKVLDIGAGYGRLAHRLTTAFPKATMYCTDKIPISQELCKKYLDFRGANSVEIVRPDDLEKIGPLDLAINIHSWPECTRPEINGWLDWLVAHNVQNLFVIPHQYNLPLFACLEDGGSFRPDIEAHGYQVAHHWRPLECSPRDFFLFKLQK